MRKYLQLVVVLAVFFSVVLVRHLREPAGQPFPREISASAVGAHAILSPSPSPQPTATQAATPAEIPPTPQPTPTVSTAAAVSVTPTTTDEATEATPTPTATPTAIPAPTPGPALAHWPRLFEGSVFKDGAFTGQPSRMSYGELQVTLVMHSGRIEDVLILEFPDRTPTSAKMSERVLPGLIAEALAKQDWDVDIISGATQTTVAFQRAMIYALRQSEKG